VSAAASAASASASAASAAAAAARAAVGWRTASSSAAERRPSGGKGQPSRTGRASSEEVGGVGWRGTGGEGRPLRGVGVSTSIASSQAGESCPPARLPHSAPTTRHLWRRGVAGRGGANLIEQRGPRRRHFGERGRVRRRGLGRRGWNRLPGLPTAPAVHGVSARQTTAPHRAEATVNSFQRSLRQRSAAARGQRRAGT
jgi:hypothetical protein